MKSFFSSEDPNNRSSKDVQHLGPATDFYKRLALDCSGQQIAVDLFLLNSQYSDLATLCESFKLIRRFKVCLIIKIFLSSWNQQVQRWICSSLPAVQR